jgi:hypothetical protein
MPVLADGLDRACLGSFVARFLVKSNLRPKAETLDAAAHTVAMKIDLTTIRDHQPAIFEVRFEVDDPAVWRRVMELDVAAGAPHIVLETPARRSESITKCDVHVLVSAILVGGTSHRDVVARNSKIDSHAIKAALMVMPVRRLDQDMAAGYPVEETVEVVDPLPDFRLDRRA